MRITLVLSALVAGLVASSAPMASAICEEERPCRIDCSDVADLHHDVNEKAGHVLPGFTCP